MRLQAEDVHILTRNMYVASVNSTKEVAAVFTNNDKNDQVLCVLVHDFLLHNLQPKNL